MNENGVFLGSAGTDKQFLPLARANRHGLVAGATGTGKTVSLQILVEGLSAAGVPTVMADVKGDLSGLAAPGEPRDFLARRAATIGFDDYAFGAVPVQFWDLYAEHGTPVRTTVSEVGPVLLSRMLDLNDTQEGVLTIAFRVADDSGLLLLDLADLRAILTHVADRASELKIRYGNISHASVGAIQRRLLVLEEQGADRFFGEPALDLRDLMVRDRDGRGIANILHAPRLIQAPRLYATFLLWLLSELFEELPEVGDPDKPELVFFFDEAHLLFDDAPDALLDKVAQVVRLIRSKGVGIFFVTQSPADIPDRVLSQLGNRIQHALRAFTPREQKAVRTAADTFRPNPDLDTAVVITELGIGEALVSVLGDKGTPSMVQRTLIRPPSSRLGPLTDRERRAVIDQSRTDRPYRTTVNRESAHELLQERRERLAREAEREEERGRRRPTRRSSRQSSGEAFTKSMVRSIGTRLGREIARNLLGTIFKSRRR